MLPPPEFGVRPQKSLNREDFDNLPKYKVKKMVAEQWKKDRTEDEFYNIWHISKDIPRTTINGSQEIN